MRKIVSVQRTGESGEASASSPVQVTRSETAPAVGFSRQYTNRRLDRFRRSRTSDPAGIVETEDMSLAPTANAPIQVACGPRSQHFTFEDLQYLQHLQEKATEASLGMSSNIEVLEEIKMFYSSLVENEGFPASLKKQCEVEGEFGRFISECQKELKTTSNRLDALLKFLEARKQLVRLSAPLFVKVKSSVSYDSDSCTDIWKRKTCRTTMH